jgi:hypothetical protein
MEQERLRQHQQNQQQRLHRGPQQQQPQQQQAVQQGQATSRPTPQSATSGQKQQGGRQRQPQQQPGQQQPQHPQQQPQQEEQQQRQEQERRRTEPETPAFQLLTPDNDYDADELEYIKAEADYIRRNQGSAVYSPRHLFSGEAAKQHAKRELSQAAAGPPVGASDGSFGSLGRASMDVVFKVGWPGGGQRPRNAFARPRPRPSRVARGRVCGQSAEQLLGRRRCASLRGTPSLYLTHR